ncbi:nucleotidyltransferase family protein [Niveibacterium sp. SC-1]|uniref:nucleotidyltransferase family protein n=1 Tax=Niveibacterium sp. SC-1 TaxID=3135646 RepID=UPI00311E5189
MSPPPVWGVLLAAGEGRRFRAAGGGDKLMHPDADGVPLALACARRLRAALQPDRGDRVLVVVRPGKDVLRRLLEDEGFAVLASPASERGMGASLASAMAVLPADAPFMVALADMPCIAPGSYIGVRDALRAGASLVQPRHADRPGHPVGFAGRWQVELAGLDGDVGARGLLQAHAAEVLGLAVDDPGILRDVDLPTQLATPA